MEFIVIPLGGAFLLAIIVLGWKIIQLNQAIRDKNRPAAYGAQAGAKDGGGEPPPWAGGVDAKTTVFVFPTLIVKDSSDVEHSYRLGFEDFTIGRAGDNQLVIPKPEVAPHHARIMLNESGYALEDLSKGAGMAVNGQKVGGKKILSDQDCVTIAGTKIVFKVS